MAKISHAARNGMRSSCCLQIKVDSCVLIPYKGKGEALLGTKNLIVAARWRCLWQHNYNFSTFAHIALFTKTNISFVIAVNFMPKPMTDCLKRWL